MDEHSALVLFLALFALYSPVAALASYLPIVRPYARKEQVRLAVGLTLNVVVFVLVAIWVGEPLLVLLGISTAALTATGGIALLLAAVPLMRGSVVTETAGEEAVAGVPWRSVLFTPLTFPLTVGGTTFAFGVAASADAESNGERLMLSVAALAYAVVTGLTLYLSGHVDRRISPRIGLILDRVAGILLTSIAVILLANGFTELVLAAAD
ncbi:MarC family protein [Actinoplanes sp. M2I2]|uniref:MarC family protein n=1 Tax=Actinoplanes sp. M2I2 TaxID=1734444 RepID=UPI0020216D51|nr:MarC family protein [Actinoplanes sp. M2I2]